jgi:prepilin-type processing-associated H-X9-DG protein
MGMGCTRTEDRVSASLGELTEAPTRFEAVLDVSHGGVLWALPALLKNGLLRNTREYFALPKGFYSVVQIFILLSYMALLRIKSPERLRYSPAGELGHLLGLDRVPEVRTLREKVKALARPKEVLEWSRQLSREWMGDNPEAAGVLYVDGHVRAYYGSQTKLPARYVARERLRMRGTTDYWVNDQIGRPFFVVSTPLTPGLLEIMRKEIAPRLLQDAPHQPTQEELKGNPHLHRFVMVFDREGYSPAFFQEMWNDRIACVTYNKLPGEDWPVSEFSECAVAMPQGQEIRIKLAERGVKMSSGIWMREIRKLTESGHQTSILSTDYDSETGLIGAFMFSRWSQENFFKYMMENYNIDGLTDYQTAPIDETAKVVNPAWRKLDREIKSKAGKLGRKMVEYGAVSLREGLGSEEIAEYERKKGSLKEEIDDRKRELGELKKRRKGTPRHMKMGELPEGERFQQMSPTRKQFIDTIRMMAYRAETAMAILLKEVMARSDDARSLLKQLFNADADLLPNLEEGVLMVRLHHLTNRMSDVAVRFLADHLNASETIYPGTNLRMVFKWVSD